MFTENEIQFVRDAWEKAGRKFVHEPRVIDLNDSESACLDFDWFSVVRYPVNYSGIGIERVTLYAVHVWEEYIGMGGHHEIMEVELATDLHSIQEAVIECLTSDARASIARDVFSIHFERKPEKV